MDNPKNNIIIIYYTADGKASVSLMTKDGKKYEVSFYTLNIKYPIFPSIKNT